MNFYDGYGRNNALNGTGYGQNMISQPSYQTNGYLPNNANYGLKNYGLQFATKTEMEALIIPPSTQVVAFGKEGDIFYIKTADNLGRSTLKEYAYKELANEQIEQPKQEFVTLDAFEQLKKEVETLIAKQEKVETVNDEQPK